MYFAARIGSPFSFRLPVSTVTPAAIMVGSKPARDDVGVPLHLALAVREDEVELALWAGELPLPQRVHDDGRDRDGALPGIGLRHADDVIAVGALPDVDAGGLEIHVGTTAGPAAPTPASP